MTEFLVCVVKLVYQIWGFSLLADGGLCCGSTGGVCVFVCVLRLR